MACVGVNFPWKFTFQNLEQESRDFFRAGERVSVISFDSEVKRHIAKAYGEEMKKISEIIICRTDAALEEICKLNIRVYWFCLNDDAALYLVKIFDPHFYIPRYENKQLENGSWIFIGEYGSGRNTFMKKKTECQFINEHRLRNLDMKAFLETASKSLVVFHGLFLQEQKRLITFISKLLENDFNVWVTATHHDLNILNLSRFCKMPLNEQIFYDFNFAEIFDFLVAMPGKAHYMYLAENKFKNPAFFKMYFQFCFLRDFFKKNAEICTCLKSVNCNKCKNTGVDCNKCKNTGIYCTCKNNCNKCKIEKHSVQPKDKFQLCQNFIELNYVYFSIVAGFNSGNFDLLCKMAIAVLFPNLIGVLFSNIFVTKKVLKELELAGFLKINHNDFEELELSKIGEYVTFDGIIVQYFAAMQFVVFNDEMMKRTDKKMPIEIENVLKDINFNCEYTFLYEMICSIIEKSKLYTTIFPFCRKEEKLNFFGDDALILKCFLRIVLEQMALGRKLARDLLYLMFIIGINDVKFTFYEKEQFNNLFNYDVFDQIRKLMDDAIDYNYDGNRRFFFGDDFDVDHFVMLSAIEFFLRGDMILPEKLALLCEYIYYSCDLSELRDQLKSTGFSFKGNALPLGIPKNHYWWFTEEMNMEHFTLDDWFENIDFEFIRCLD